MSIYGVGLASATTPGSIYKSERRRKRAAGATKPKPFEAELVPGVTASVPLTLYVDSLGTLPHGPLPDSSILANEQPLTAEPGLAE